jgi:hypothetical protein
LIGALRVALAAIVFVLLALHPAAAQERITNFVGDIAIATDGTITVRETIAVQAENISINRGIFRDIPTLYTSAFTSGGIPPRQVAIRNVKFDEAPSPTQTTIRLRYSVDGARNLTQRDEVFVYNYNQVPGDDFRVYFNEQRPDFVVPETIWADATKTYAVLTGAPTAGLTNDALWSVYGRAVAGTPAPCLNSRLAIGGLVCPITGSPGGLGGSAPGAPTNLRITR